jgi:hypothetical protein
VAAPAQQRVTARTQPFPYRLDTHTPNTSNSWQRCLRSKNRNSGIDSGYMPVHLFPLLSSCLIVRGLYNCQSGHHDGHSPSTQLRTRPSAHSRLLPGRHHLMVPRYRRKGARHLSLSHQARRPHRHQIKNGAVVVGARRYSVLDSGHRLRYCPVGILFPT